MRRWMEIAWVLLLGAAVPTQMVGQQPTDLRKAEDLVALQFNDIRRIAGLPMLKHRRDLRLRMAACAVAQRGPDAKVEEPRSDYKIWYLTQDPNRSSEELVRLAHQNTDRDYVGVGVWFAKPEQHSNGAYWVVVYPEHGAAHEGFWGHFYLTDDFQKQTIFDKAWMKRLPTQCRDLK